MLSRVVVLVAFAFAGCITVPSGRDADEAKNVSDALLARYRFPVMYKLNPSRPAAGARPGVLRGTVVTSVVVIGVTKSAEQDQVIAVLRDIRRELNTKNPIIVNFFRDERVETWSDPSTGRSGAHREDVDLLRRVHIE